MSTCSYFASCLFYFARKLTQINSLRSVQKQKIFYARLGILQGAKIGVWLR